MSLFSSNPASLPTAQAALPGRDEPLLLSSYAHAVFGTDMRGPFTEGVELAMFGMGCFWGAERKFWQAQGVVSTSVGYAAGFTKNPTYEEVCSGRTGHNEVVRVAFDRAATSFEALARVFFENHDPTQGMRQGNDRGTQYRSGIYVFDDVQRATAARTRDAFQAALREAGRGEITTEILDAPEFYFAEQYHQQYLHKNPQGYCGLGGTGVTCPAG